jgi:hypothetical protein
MNDQDPTSGGFGPVPPMIPPHMSPTAIAQPLGANPAERVPISGLAGAIEAMLRQPRRMLFQIKQPNSGSLVVALLAITVICSVIYGIVVGTFSGAEQLWAAPAKITIGLILSALICLPSLYIFSCLGGSQARLLEVFGLVAGFLALLTVLLIGFVPVAWVFSQSTKSLVAMGTLHLLFWLVAAIFGVRFLNSGFRHFDIKHYAGLRLWVVVFLLVALQMTTALRPIIGRSNTLLPAASDKKFFLGYWLDCLDAPAEIARPIRD